MKTPALVLSLIISAVLASLPTQVIAENGCASGSCEAKGVAREQVQACSAAITDIKNKTLLIKTARENYEHSKTKTNRCNYLRFQMEYLVDASRMLKLCESPLRPTPASLVEKNQAMLQKTKDLQVKYCAQANLAQLY